ncbi:hypothetical protein XACS582_14450002 [Xanthomonas citri pv. citri]|nr:hypothetical protein XACS584_1720010 [Xanthomonas citri pv. citri]CEH61244.1 hypothetical protein XACS582_14450002 [Xanthomonas citri pv. citri]CEH98989.1 hypothetical protein XACS581_2350008 [Xanthomonas citri pv. citri]
MSVAEGLLVMGHFHRKMEVGIKQGANSSMGSIQKLAALARSLGVRVFPMGCFPHPQIRYPAKSLINQGFQENLCRFIAVNCVLFAVNKLTK